ILNQTYPAIEITVVDDCSDDNSDHVIRQMQKEYRFRYFRRDSNSGTPFGAWEFIAQNFDSGFLWICESDDFAERGFAEEGVSELMASPNAVLFYSNSWVVNSENARIGSTATYFGEIWRDDRWQERFMAPGPSELTDYQCRGMTVPNMSSA